MLSSARMTARSSYLIHIKGSMVELVYGNCNRMSLVAGNVVTTSVSKDELSMVSINFDVLLPEMQYIFRIHTIYGRKWNTSQEVDYYGAWRSNGTSKLVNKFPCKSQIHK